MSNFSEVLGKAANRGFVALGIGTAALTGPDASPAAAEHSPEHSYSTGIDATANCHEGTVRVTSLGPRGGNQDINALHGEINGIIMTPNPKPNSGELPPVPITDGLNFDYTFSPSNFASLSPNSAITAYLIADDQAGGLELNVKCDQPSVISAPNLPNTTTTVTATHPNTTGSPEQQPSNPYNTTSTVTRGYSSPSASVTYGSGKGSSKSQESSIDTTNNSQSSDKEIAARSAQTSDTSGVQSGSIDTAITSPSATADNKAPYSQPNDAVDLKNLWNTDPIGPSILDTGTPEEQTAFPWDKLALLILGATVVLNGVSFAALRRQNRSIQKP